MLVLSRRLDETIEVSFNDKTLEIKVLDIGRGHVRLGFTGPREIQISRGKVVKAAESTPQEVGR